MNLIGFGFFGGPYRFTLFGTIRQHPQLSSCESITNALTGFADGETPAISGGNVLLQALVYPECWALGSPFQKSFCSTKPKLRSPGKVWIFSELHLKNPTKFKGAKGIRDYQRLAKLRLWPKHRAFLLSHGYRSVIILSRWWHSGPQISKHVTWETIEISRGLVDLCNSLGLHQECDAPESYWYVPGGAVFRACTETCSIPPYEIDRCRIWCRVPVESEGSGSCNHCHAGGTGITRISDGTITFTLNDQVDKAPS